MGLTKELNNITYSNIKVTLNNQTSWIKIGVIDAAAFGHS